MRTAAALIREARSRSGLTQAELARKLEVSQPVIARLEREGANPTILTLDRVIAATGHSLDVTLAAPSGIDESMIAEDLKLTPDERLRHFESFYGFAKNVGGRAFRSDGS